LAAITEEKTAIDSKECNFIVSRFPKKARKLWWEYFNSLGTQGLPTH
jgi:hypothetical protein